MGDKVIIGTYYHPQVASYYYRQLVSKCPSVAPTHTDTYRPFVYTKHANESTMREAISINEQQPAMEVPRYPMSRADFAKTRTGAAKYKKWQFTIYNAEEEEWWKAIELSAQEHPNKPLYFGYGFEKCPSTGKLHMQGGLEWLGRKTGAQVMDILLAFSESVQGRPLGPGSRWPNIRRHVDLQNPNKAGSSWVMRQYCSKEWRKMKKADPNAVMPPAPQPGYFFECGDVPEAPTQGSYQGKRTDWHDLLEAIKGGASRGELYTRFPQKMCKNPNGINQMIAHYAPRRKWGDKMTVIWLPGYSGTGKTTYARKLLVERFKCGTDEFGEPKIFMKTPGKWWGLYDYQECCIYDDWRAGAESFSQLLRILQGVPLTIQDKGSHKHINVKVMIITCPYNWDSIEVQTWAGDENMWQLGRRIDEIWEFRKRTAAEIKGDIFPDPVRVPHDKRNPMVRPVTAQAEGFVLPRTPHPRANATQAHLHRTDTLSSPRGQACSSRPAKQRRLF